MSGDIKRVVCVGEATIELARGGDGRFALASSGDTFNTAIYLARAGQPVAFASALGDDTYSDAIVSLAKAEGIDTDLIVRMAGRLPTLALVDANLKGERRSHVWRDSAPARDLFELPNWSLTAAALTTARLIYFSGITLSLYSNIGLGRFLPRSNWRERPAQKSLSTAISVLAVGTATSHAHARSLPKRSSASTSRCRPMTMKPCCGAIRRRKRPSSGYRLSAWPRSSSRTDPMARWWQIQPDTTWCRCPRWWCRSMRPPPATASMPVISPPGLLDASLPKRRRLRTASPARLSAIVVPSRRAAAQPYTDAHDPVYLSR